MPSDDPALCSQIQTLQAQLDQRSASNAAFDASLRQRDPRWGLRDLDWIDDLLTHRPMNLVGRHAMPANNTTLVLRRR